ncbi:hypothetical protein BJ878DRAFT_482270 [Calycina marina]|uniref:Uncharacterized protein n=1 Tax=Calycina marina TaxID=1763456 RepID=A0A9P7YYS7_9HELO|nr:hypothetical protein BJ878DRAFT_482270 [Calycina marina]
MLPNVTNTPEKENFVARESSRFSTACSDARNISKYIAFATIGIPQDTLFINSSIGIIVEIPEASAWLIGHSRVSLGVSDALSSIKHIVIQRIYRSLFNKDLKLEITTGNRALASDDGLDVLRVDSQIEAVVNVRVDYEVHASWVEGRPELLTEEEVLRYDGDAGIKNFDVADNAVDIGVDPSDPVSVETGPDEVGNVLGPGVVSEFFSDIEGVGIIWEGVKTKEYAHVVLVDGLVGNSLEKSILLIVVELSFGAGVHPHSVVGGNTDCCKFVNASGSDIAGELGFKKLSAANLTNGCTEGPFINCLPRLTPLPLNSVQSVNVPAAIVALELVLDAEAMCEIVLDSLAVLLEQRAVLLAVESEVLSPEPTAGPPAARHRLLRFDDPEDPDEDEESQELEE